MNKFDELIKFLESDDLYFEASLANDFSSLRRRLLRLRVKEKLETYVLTENNLQGVLDYMNSLITIAEMGKYINDIPLCGCLLFLSEIPQIKVIQDVFNHLMTSSTEYLRWASNFAIFLENSSNPPISINSIGAEGKNYKNIEYITTNAQNFDFGLTGLIISSVPLTN